MRKLTSGFAGFLALLLCANVAMATGTVKHPQTETLPSGPAWALAKPCVAATSAPAGGHAHAAPAHGQPDYSGSSLAAALQAIPADLRSRLQLCQWAADSWVAIPRGWHEHMVAIGADGDAGWEFVSPKGASEGFVAIGNTPACQSCMLGDANGYFKGAHRLYVAQYGPQPRAVLTPQPDSMTHPSRCSVRVSYHIDGLVARNEDYWVPPFVGNDGLMGITVALPPGHARLRHVMLASFWGSEPASARYCPEHGWPSGPPVHASATISQPLPGPDWPKLVTVPVRDAAGKPVTGVHAKLRAALTSTPPTLRIAIPAALRDKIMLRPSLHGNGWAVLPRHWRLRYAHSVGAGGIGTRVWVSPQGANHGWVIEARDWPYTGGKALAGNALIPDAQALIDGTAPAHAAPVALTPTPLALSHPDRCTTTFTYHAGGLIVKGIAWMQLDQPGHPQMHQPFASLREIFVALPPGHAKLQALIVQSFKSRLPQPNAHSSHVCAAN